MALENKYASPGRVTWVIVGWEDDAIASPEVGKRLGALVILDEFDDEVAAMHAAKKIAKARRGFVHVIKAEYANSFDVETEPKIRFKTHIKMREG